MANTPMIFSVLLALLCTVSVEATCHQALLWNGQQTVDYGEQLLNGDTEFFGKFIGHLDNICSQCDLDCGFLDVINFFGVNNQTRPCIANITVDLEGLVERVISHGDTINTDDGEEFVQAVYDALKPCGILYFQNNDNEDNNDEENENISVIGNGEGEEGNDPEGHEDAVLPGDPGYGQSGGVMQSRRR